MNPYKSLIDILSKPSRVPGVIVAVSASMYSVSTTYGGMQIPKKAGDTYILGDAVIAANGAILGKITGIANLPVYHV